MKRKNSLSLKQLAVMCCLLVALTCLTLFLFVYKRDEKRFAQISSQLFTEEMAGNTLNMHYTLAYPENFGIYDYKPTLPCYNARNTLAGQAATENILAALNNLDAEKLPPKERSAYVLLKRSLENSLQLNHYAYYDEPLSPSSGMQTQLPVLLAEYTFRRKQDVEDYLALLDQTDEYFASLLAFEQEKAENGLLMPASSLDKVKKQCDTIVTLEELNAGTHFLQTTFAERLRALAENGLITEKEAAAYQVQNDRLLRTVLLPAYETLADGLFVLEDDSIPLEGLAAKPEGAAYYRHLLAAQTGSYRDISQIKELLLEQFSIEYSAVHSLLTEHPELAESPSETAAFPFQDAESMLGHLQSRMTADFPPLPGAADSATTDSAAPNAAGLPAPASRVAVTVKTVSPNLENYCAPAFYLTTPIDNPDNNVIYINEKNSPKGLELYTTLAHEGYPGHLYQTVYSSRSLSAGRENNVRQILWYGGYLEGWALYVEFLSFDYASEAYEAQGLARESAYAQLEKHTRSLQLCLYTLLDIMIHYDNAPYSQVSDVLSKFGISSPSSIDAVYTYIAEEPCNYPKYYLGYLEILELKDTAQALWKDSYSDYAFHTFYLECSPSDFTSLGERLESYSSIMLSR